MHRSLALFSARSGSVGVSALIVAPLTVGNIAGSVINKLNEKVPFYQQLNERDKQGFEKDFMLLPTPALLLFEAARFSSDY